MVACWVAILVRAASTAIHSRRRRSGRPRRRYGPAYCRREGSPQDARNPRAQHRVVGAHIGVVGRDEKRPTRRSARRRRPAASASSATMPIRISFSRSPLSALARSALAQPAGFGSAGRGGRSGVSAGRRARSRRRMGAKLVGESSGGFARGLAVSRIRLRCEGCVRPGLSLRPSRPPQVAKSRRKHGPKPTLPPRNSKLALTERFGQGIFSYAEHIVWQDSFQAFPGQKSFRKAKPMVAANPHFSPGRRR